MSELVITHSLVADKQRSLFLPSIVADNSMVAVKYEQAVFNTMNKFTEHYLGGYWDFVVFSNGARAMLFKLDDATVVACENDDNYFDGQITLRALSLACNLYVCSHLSFQMYGDVQDALSRNFVLLREASFSDELFKPEMCEIWGLLD